MEARSGRTWIFPALFCAFYLGQAVFINHFWTFSGDYFDATASKRLFPVFTIGASVGGLLGGGAAVLLTEVWGPSALIACWGLLLLAAAGELRLLRDQLRRWGPLELEEADDTSVENIRGALGWVGSSRLGIWLCLSALGMVLALFVAQYLYSDIFLRTYPDPTALAAFFGLYLAFTNLLEIAIEVAVTPWLIRRYGVPTAHLVHPLLTLVSFGGLASSYGLTAGIAARMNRELVENALAQPVRTLAYNALPARFRGRLRAFIEGIVVYAGMALAGSLLLAFPGASPGLLSGLGVLAALLYLSANWQVRRAYLATLVSVIREGHLDLSEVQEEIGDWEATRLADICRELMSEPRPGVSRSLRQVVATLARHGVSAPLLEGSRHESPEVRRLCVAALAECEGAGVPAVFEVALTDTDAEVRRLALEALLARGSDALARHGAHLRADASPEVRALAAAGSGDSTGLRAMLNGSTEDRVAALAQVESTLQAEAHTALGNAAPAVRAAALRALGRLGSPPDLATLARACRDDDPELRRAAVAGLLAAGDRQAAACLAPLLADPVPQVRSDCIRALAQMDGGIDAATPYLRDERERAVLAAQRAIAGHDDPRGRSLLKAELRHRVHQLWFRAVAYQELPSGAEPARRLLREAYADAMLRSRRIAFELLALLENERIVASVERALRHGNARQRGDALEVLSHLGDRDSAQALAVLHETGTFRDRRQAVGDLVVPHRGLPDLVEASKRSEMRWVRMAAEALDDDGDSDETLPRAMESLLALRQISLFAGLSLEQLDAIARIATESRYAAGEVIVREGDAGSELFLVLQGSADVFLAYGSPAQRRVNGIEAVDYFGEMSVLDGEPRSATIVAREPCRLLELEGDGLKALIREMPEISFEIFRVLTGRVRKLERQATRRTGGEGSETV